ncbi:DUF192 domain-containing protein [Pseudidiomarina aquimaris]|uniref:DUF192 domain-containing protein n=1 Tax=Pseudidiomarina aquimaris TaxID=641841 RepID=A0A432XPZ5_9GAMM|nr:DUF192 domain-containing protein [Pseudidiomarina aquimaris]RUO50754.1 hypothetical protein CWE21_01220 [Pseudidiomarina aquimaris]|tara:strand:- start:3983 stop:4510 length:528 start_codon:yes stop_codon:yes gene_type:complete
MKLKSTLLTTVALVFSGLSTQVYAQHAQDECGTDAKQTCSYEVTQLCVAEHKQPMMQVEIADTFGKRARGLMHREQLAQDQGMWFVYPTERPGYSGFWMHNTLIPLDIAYLDKDLRVVKTFTMQPCTSKNPRNCPSYRPDANYWSALEMSAGYFATHDIKVGTQLQQCQQQESNR